MRDELEQSRRIQIDKKVIEAFQTSESIGPFTGAYDVDTAEYAALEFLEGWKKKNFGRMAKHAVNLTRKPLKQMAGDIRGMVEFIALDEYEIIRIRHSTVARCDVRVRIRAKTLAKAVAGEFNLLLIRYTADGGVAMPTDQACIWTVQQNCIYNVMNEKFADPA